MTETYSIEQLIALERVRTAAKHRVMAEKMLDQAMDGPDGVVARCRQALLAKVPAEQVAIAAEVDVERIRSWL